MRTPRVSAAVPIALWISIGTAGLLAACATQAEKDGEALCRELGDQLSEPARLSGYAVDGQQVDDGVWRIKGFDVDGDHVADDVIRSCPGSSSIVPADPCTIEFTPSSTGKTVVLEEQRLYVIDYKSRVYVVGGRADSDRGPFHTYIYELTPVGARTICSYES